MAAGTASANAQGETIGRLKHATTSYQEPTKQSVPVHFNLKPGQQISIVCFTEGEESRATTTGSGSARGASWVSSTRSSSCRTAPSSTADG